MAEKRRYRRSGFGLSAGKGHFSRKPTLRPFIPSPWQLDILPVMAAVGFVVDPATFERKSVGPVWGTIFFQFEQGCFPAPRWSDIVVPVITEWLVATRIAAGTSGTHELYFMDGPYSITVRRIDQTSVCLVLVDNHPTKLTTQVSANLSMLLENAITVGNQVERECRTRAWHDRDTASLSNELQRAARLA